MWMFPIALACGNTFVLKPSEKDPSFGVKIRELLKEAGLPGGVFNVVHGDREAVDALNEDRSFLTQGDVFTDEQISAYIDLKWEEIYRFEHTPHPVEFDMYYSL